MDSQLSSELEMPLRINFECTSCFAYSLETAKTVALDLAREDRNVSNHVVVCQFTLLGHSNAY